MNLATLLETVARVLGVLKLLEPILGKDAPLVNEVLGIVSKVLDGARTGKASYEMLHAELGAVVVSIEAVIAKGGATGDDMRAEVGKIRERGSRLDAILAGNA